MSEEYRKLVTLMLTDIVAYTAMVQRDEALTLRLLSEHNSILRQLFTEHRGREIKCTGDGFLVEFESPIRALECALAIHADLEAYFAGSPDGESLRLRIGIHLGDVVHRDEDVFGDGVNVTARIEPLAETGGTCISRQVYDHVHGRADAHFDCLGKKRVKNVQEPIEVFRVLPATGNAIGGRLQGPDRTRIAVLPLANTSPDPGDAYFADGMTEELIYTLSKIQGLHVIAQTSIMLYKDSPKSIPQIAAELDVGSVLEGSVRKAGNTVRITTQLIDATTQDHIWSERYDRQLEAVFDIQSEIAQQVAAALEVHLVAQDQHEIAKRSTENLDAYSLFLRGRLFWSRRAPDSLNRAVSLFRQAIDLDPGYALAHAGLADTLLLMPGFFSSLSSALTYPQAKDAALRAIELDGTLAEPHATLGLISSHYEYDFEESERQFEKAISLRSSYATARHWRAILYMYTKRFQEAEQEYQRALELDPLSVILNADLGQFYYYSRQFDRAAAQLRDTLDIEPRFPYARTFLAATLIQQGDPEAALQELAKTEGWTPEGIPWMGWTYSLANCLTGNQDRAQELLDRLLAKQRETYVAPCHLAFLHFALDRIDEGFSYLEQACEERDVLLIYVIMDPYLDRYRSHPKAVEMAERIHAEPWLTVVGKQERSGPSPETAR